MLLSENYFLNCEMHAFLLLHINADISLSICKKKYLVRYNRIHWNKYKDLGRIFILTAFILPPSDSANVARLIIGNY